MRAETFARLAEETLDETGESHIESGAATTSSPSTSSRTSSSSTTIASATTTNGRTSTTITSDATPSTSRKTHFESLAADSDAPARGTQPPDRYHHTWRNYQRVVLTQLEKSALLFTSKSPHGPGGGESDLPDRTSAHGSLGRADFLEALEQVNVVSVVRSSASSTTTTKNSKGGRRTRGEEVETVGEESMPLQTYGDVVCQARRPTAEVYSASSSEPDGNLPRRAGQENEKEISQGGKSKSSMKKLNYSNAVEQDVANAKVW
ncbi:unnamed protein product, partial [Amoebophrya sp. A25]|eukprot:GSA25T00012101001.1